MSVSVGMPKEVPRQKRNVCTGAFNGHVCGRRGVGELNIDGDGQVDLAGHGAEQRAGFGYQIDSYRSKACDVPVRWLSRTGVGHTCETTLIAGTVGFSPDPVGPPADGSALMCCSQPRERMELDL